MKIYRDILILAFCCLIYSGFTYSKSSLAEISGAATGALIGSTVITYIFWRLLHLYKNTLPEPQYKDDFLQYNAVYLSLYFVAEQFQLI